MKSILPPALLSSLVLALVLGLPSPVRAAASAACIACTEWYDVPGAGEGFLKGHLGLCARCKAGSCGEGAVRLRKSRAELDAERRAVRLLPDGDSNKDRRVRVLQAKLEFLDKAWVALLADCPAAGDLEGAEADEPPRHQARSAEASLIATGLRALADTARDRSGLHQDLRALGALLGCQELGPAVAWDVEAMRVQAELGRLRGGLAETLDETAREWELLTAEEERAAQQIAAGHDATRPDSGDLGGVPGDWRGRFLVESRESPPPPATASVPERHGLEVLAQRVRVLEHLRACRVALGRYRRAWVAWDGAAVEQQARALEEHAERARTAAEEAAAKQGAFDRDSDSTTRAVGATLLADRLQWEATFADLQPRVAVSEVAGSPGSSLVAVVADLAERGRVVGRLRALTLDGLAEALGRRPAGGSAGAALKGLPDREKLLLELLLGLGRRIQRRLAGTTIELVPDAGPPRQWWAAPSGRVFTPIEALAWVGQVSPVLLPGRYDVHASQDGEDLQAAVPRTLVVSTAVEVRAGVSTRVTLAGELAPVPGNGVESPVAWYALRVDGGRAGVVAGRSNGSLEPLYVPPGRYEVLWAASADQRGQPVRVAGPVEVTAGHRTPIAVASGIRLELGSRMPPFGSAGTWSVVRTGEPLEARVCSASHPGVMPLSPGRYDVLLALDAEHADRPTPLAEGIEVVAGAVAPVRIQSGLEWAGDPDSKGGWWGASLPGMSAGARLGWSRGGTVVPLAPGRYDVYRAASGDPGVVPARIAVDVEVRAGALTRVGGSERAGGGEP